MAEKKILVAYTTNAGSTAKVAQAVCEELGKKGAQVEIQRLEDVSELGPYAAVVVGGPMIMGWHSATVKFVKMHQDALSRVPVAYFMTAMSLTGLGETTLDGVPVCIDPKLPKPPKNAKRLSFRENYATVANYLRPVLKSAPRVKPASVGFFGGKLEMGRLKLWQQLFVMFIIQAQPGGSHNMSFIRNWAAGLFPNV